MLGSLAMLQFRAVSGKRVYRSMCARWRAVLESLLRG